MGRLWKIGGLAALGALGLPCIVRRAAGFAVKSIIRPVITEKYENNLWELVIGTQRLTPDGLVETELRAASDDYIERPLGTQRKFNYLDKILFNAAQLAVLPAPLQSKVDMSVVIGPAAARPLKLQIPILIGGMAYGMALSEQFKIAFARGATLAGTATNTGQGPWLPAERAAARCLILQYSRGSWNKDVKILRQADAVEIQLGQGARAGAGFLLPVAKISKKVRRQAGLAAGQDLVVENRLREATTPKELGALISRLKEVTGGVPVGVKIAAGKYLEQDLEIITWAGADFVSVDGREGGTHLSMPILEDDFGLPTLIATCRAVRFWRENGLKGKVSLLVGGGLVTPGDCLKILALGADAVYLGTAVLIATTHTQALKAVPFEPPTQIAYADGYYHNKFNVDEGARSLARFLKSTVREMEEAIKALGKTALYQVGPEDMFTVDRDVAQITGLELAFYPPRR
ncbi:FMN-binding glutamate synthase family protein [Desulfurispora thermophila]|uniref:FMN-binding glutamate synthase family protein n=1 Tax=Desulfurispora thermophila TaxID=265470 RepID=UPI001FA7181C|nr:FMN-binding glutamate synthase family protein [Desulfurispora thermophila]